MINKKIENCLFMRAHLNNLLCLRPAGKVNWKANSGKTSNQQTVGLHLSGADWGAKVVAGEAPPRVVLLLLAVWQQLT